MVFEIIIELLAGLGGIFSGKAKKNERYVILFIATLFLAAVLFFLAMK